MAPWRAPDVARRLPRVLVGIVLSLPVLLVGGVLLASVVFVRDPVPDADTVRLTVRGRADPGRGERRLLPPALRAARRDPDRTPGCCRAGSWPTRSRRPPSRGAARTGRRRSSCAAGSPDPPEGATGPLRDVVGVDWVAVADDTPGSTTWVTVDRAVHIGLTVPDEFGEAPLLDVSRGVKIALVSR